MVAPAVLADTRDLFSRTVAAVLPLLAAPVLVDAQYFGRNKVRYESFDFRVLASRHFDVHYYPAEEQAARMASRMAERWYERLHVLLGHELTGRQPIILYAGHPDFEQTNVIGGVLGESTGGVTESLKRRVVLPFAGAPSETDHVLGHELVHAFQFDLFSRSRRSALNLPLWFVEGMAEYLSVGPVDAHTAMWMRDAARADKLPAVRDLDHPRYFPYRYGHAFWAYVAGRWGDEAVGRALKAATRTSRGPIRALERTLLISEADLSRDWHRAVRDADGAQALEGLSAFGRRLVAGTKAGVLNIAPALSPDGRRLVFLSEREGHSLELFLADAETGRVLRRLLKHPLDPHFDSLQFIHSAGAWDASGRRFAIAAVRRGQAVVSILDVDGGRIEREIRLPSLEEVLNPTWSPDGTRLAFAAIHGGLTDLFVYDLAADRLTALTDDAFAELHPAWSPDGASIAFVTDRFSTRLPDLEWGDYRLATYVLETGAVEPLPCFPGAKNVNPQWGARGRVLYFLSDRGGITNVYRIDIESSEIRQVTDAALGVSGLTALSPALASATDTDRVVVSAYGRGRYHLHSLEEPRVLAGRDIRAKETAFAALVPLARATTTVADFLGDARRGLPDADAASEVPYRPRLTTDRLGQPYVAVGSDRFGLFVTGGASLFWSDLLGNHNVATALDMKGGPKDISGRVAYQNRKRRWIWGATAEQLAFGSGTASTGYADEGGHPVSVEQLVRFRETDRRVAGLIAYPFHRTERLEISAAVRHVTFSSEVRTRAFSLDTGVRLRETRAELPSVDSLTLGELGAAFVHDSAQFGPTGPIRGARTRLEIAPTFGSRTFAGVLADVRRYAMPKRPFTVAARVLHYGRYGADADRSRLAPLFVGFPSLVRGYDVSALGATATCVPGACARMDGLVGSKVLVSNVELRMPVLALFRPDRPYGPVPAEIALFFDAGLAWSGTGAPAIFGDRSPSVRSWGAALRINLFGFAVGELDYVRPLDLPGKSALWRFRLAPGF
jgi:Tol biopolymer transport system component